LRNVFACRSLRKYFKDSCRTRAEGYILIDSRQVESPFSILNCIFLDSSRLSRVEVNLILDHEASHIRQKHWVDLICHEFILLLQWFNPLVWIYAMLQKENHEFLADKAVLEKGNSSAVYQATLVNQQFGGPVFSLANSFNRTSHINRMNMMKRRKSPPWKRIAVLAILPLFGVFVIVSATPRYVYEDAIPAASDTGILTHARSGAPARQRVANVDEDIQLLDQNSIQESEVPDDLQENVASLPQQDQVYNLEFKPDDPKIVTGNEPKPQNVSEQVVIKESAEKPEENRATDNTVNRNKIVDSPELRNILNQSSDASSNDKVVPVEVVYNIVSDLTAQINDLNSKLAKLENSGQGNVTEDSGLVVESMNSGRVFDDGEKVTVIRGRKVDLIKKLNRYRADEIKSFEYFASEESGEHEGEGILVISLK